MQSTTRAVFAASARWSALAIGIGLTTLSFVQLVEVHNKVAHAAPWWWVGLIGVALTVLGLGAPWSRRSRGGAASRGRGS